MRKYKITAIVDSVFHSKIIDAKNSNEAYDKALSYGHALSNYGESGYLERVHVTPIKSDETTCTRRKK